jgi:hypothetical protein
VTVTLNQRGLRGLLESSHGPVAADMKRRADNVLLAAVHNAGEMFHVRTGNLIRSLKSRLDTTAGGTVGVVYADPDVAPYAIHLEVGTAPHPIVATNPSGWLASYPDNPTPLDRPRRAVNHPGNPAFGFLTDALRDAAR